MKINKRLLSFFLAVLMVVSTFGDSVYAITENAKANSTNKKTEIEGKVEGDKEVFTFDLSEFKSKESVAPMTAKAMPARAPRRAPVQWDTQVNITTIGLNGKAFDWTALPNKEFKLIAKWETTDGQKREKEITTITNTSDTKQFANVGWPVDGTMKGNASVVTNYNGNIGVRVAITSGSATGGSGKLTFDITLTELAEPRVNIEYVDPYGRPITEPADLPSAADTMPKVTAEELTDVEIDLPKASKQINMRSSDDIDDDELNLTENGLTYKVDGKEDEAKVTIGGKEYKLDISQPNAKEIATIKMVYQKDVVIPPTKDDGNPVDLAQGYVRLTFDANENKAGGVTGTHNAGAYKGQQKSYIDVKEGLDYTNDNLQTAIKALSTTGTKLVGTETKQYAQDAENPWTPKVPTDTTKVATATYNAQYKKSAAEQVEELGGLDPVTIKVWKGDPIEWSKGVTPKTTDDNDAAVVQSLLGKAKVTDITVPTRNSSKAGKFQGKLKLSFDDGSSLEVDNQWLYVWEHVVVIDPDNTDPDAPQKEDLPRDKITVIFKAGEGIVNINTNGKTTYAKPNATLADTDFPADITYTDGYKNEVTWTPTDHKVDTKNRKYYDSKRQRFTFTAKAEKEKTADKVKALGGLENKDFGVFVGTDVNAKDFWKKGVQVATSVTEEAKKTEIQGYLDHAKTTFADMSSRTTDQENLNPTAGKIKVTFEDGSFIEVENQKLYVWAKKTENNDDNKDKPKPEGAIQVSFAKGDGVTALAPENKTMTVESGQTLEEKDFPQATVDKANGYKEPATWSGQTADNPKDYKVTENNKVFTAKAEKDTNFDKTNIVTITFVKDPDKMTYTEGEPLNQDGLKIKLKDKNGNEVTIGKDQLNEYGVTVTPNDGTNLTINDHNGKNLIASVNDKDGKPITANSPGTLTVTKKVEGKPSVNYPTTDMDKGETKTVIPEIKDKNGEPTRPDTTPDVVQPGNGVVVNPNPDGSITVTIPKDYDGPNVIVIPVEVTVGGEKIKTNLVIRVNDDKPVIDNDIPELKIHEYTPTYPVYTSVDKRVVEVEDKEVINSHDQYIFGYPDDTIRPDGDMTRAEAIAVVARLQKLDLSDKSSKIYKDTKADMWYNGAINAAFKEGYLLEKEGENVRPNDKITRAELAELISHIDKKNNAIAPFDDVKGHKFEAAINQAYGNGRIEGYPDGTFKPDNFITRAEVATMLNKLYDRYPDKNFIDANQNLVHNYKDMSYKGHWGYYELVEAYHSHTYLRLKDNMEEWKVIIK